MIKTLGTPCLEKIKACYLSNDKNDVNCRYLQSDEVYQTCAFKMREQVVYQRFLVKQKTFAKNEPNQACLYKFIALSSSCSDQKAKRQKVQCMQENFGNIDNRYWKECGSQFAIKTGQFYKLLTVPFYKAQKTPKPNFTYHVGQIASAIKKNPLYFCGSKRFQKNTDVHEDVIRTAVYWYQNLLQ